MQFPQRFSGRPECAFVRLRAVPAGHAPGGLVAMRAAAGGLFGMERVG